MVNSRRLYFGLLRALMMERTFELILSARNIRRARARGAVEVARRHFVGMFFVHGLLTPTCAYEVVRKKRRFPGTVGYLALGGALAAQDLRYWAIATLGDRWNVRIVFVPGEQPVTRGPYRWVRHPNYAAVALEMACVPMIHGAWMSALAFSAANAVLLTVRIRAEERALGDAYARAFADKPRFLPGVTHEHRGGRARRNQPDPALGVGRRAGSAPG